MRAVLTSLSSHALSAFQEAKYHMQRCIDSGLWVPNAKTAEGAEKGGEEAEAVYEEVKKESSEEEKGNL